MKMNDYQSQAMETAVYPKDKGLEYTMIGIANEAGELLGKLKKYIRGDEGAFPLKYSSHALNNKVLTPYGDKMVDELGDILWYVALAALELGVSLNEVANRNLLKLADRSKRNQIKGSGDNR